MNFWDLGMVSTGPAYNQWEMLSFQPSIPASFATSTTAFVSTYHEELLAKIFEVDVENWSTHYKRIVPEMDYGLLVEGLNDATSGIGSTELLDSSNPNFTNAGLKADPQWFTTGYFPWINFSDSSSLVTFSVTPMGDSVLNHITTEYDINAPAADFTPSKKMDVFLVPSLPYVRGRLDYWSGGTRYVQQLNDFFHLYDRSIFLNPAHPLYEINGHFILGQGIGTTYNAGAYSTWEAVRDYAKTLDNARARYSTTDPPSFTSSDDGTNFGNIASPGYGAGAVLSDTTNFVSFLAGNSSAFLGNPANQTRLRCVIRQNGTFYYVWNIAYT